MGTINSRPLGGVLEVGGEGPCAITPGLLVFGRSRPSSFISSLTGFDDPVSVVRESRQIFYAILYPEIRRKVAQALQLRSGGTDPHVFAFGDPLLVKYQAQRVLQEPWRVGHCVGIEGERVLVSCNGRISSEHHYNLSPLLLPEASLCRQVPWLLPNRRGQLIVVLRTPREPGRRGRPDAARRAAREAALRWFSARIIWQRRNGDILIMWIRPASSLPDDGGPDVTETVILSAKGTTWRPWESSLIVWNAASLPLTS